MKKTPGTRPAIYPECLGNKAPEPDEEELELEKNHSHFFLIDSEEEERRGFGRARSFVESCLARPESMQGKTVWEDWTKSGKVVNLDEWKKDEKTDEASDIDNGSSHKSLWLPSGDEDEDERKAQSAVPVVLVCVQGDPGTPHVVRQAVEEGTAVLVVKGSGKAADLVADLVLLRLPLEHKLHQLGKTPEQQELEKLVEKLCPDKVERKEKPEREDYARNVFNLLMECTHGVSRQVFQPVVSRGGGGESGDAAGRAEKVLAVERVGGGERRGKDQSAEKACGGNARRDPSSAVREQAVSIPPLVLLAVLANAFVVTSRTEH
eukprot:2504815-Rhodomonas_salina.2